MSQSSGVPPSAIFDISCILHNVPQSETEQRLLECWFGTKDERKFFGHNTKMSKQFEDFRSANTADRGERQQHVGHDSETEEKRDIWHLTSTKSDLNGPLSEIKSVTAGGGLVVRHISTRLLHRFSPTISANYSPDSVIEIDASGFDKRTIDIVVSFLRGDLHVSLDWLEQLSTVAVADLEMISIHLDIPVLQCISIESLERALINDGKCPNWRMVTHVWTLSHDKDPIRRLCMASIYLNLCVMAGNVKTFAEKRRLEEWETVEGMWLYFLRDMLESYSNLDKAQKKTEWRTWDVMWDPRFFKYQTRLSEIFDIVRELREKSVILDDSFFKFIDDPANLQRRIQRLRKQYYTSVDPSQAIEMPSATAAEEPESPPSPAKSSSKRKLADDSAPSPRPTKSARPGNPSVLINCHDTFVRVDRQVLMAVSKVASRRLNRFPTLTALRFPDFQATDLKAFLSVASDVDTIEEKCKEDDSTTIRVMIGMIAVAEHLESPERGERLLAILKLRFEEEVMNIATVQWISQNTLYEKSQLKHFAYECMHWVAMKNGRTSISSMYYLCTGVGDGLGELYERMRVLQEEFGEMYAVEKDVKECKEKAVEKEVKEKKKGKGEEAAETAGKNEKAGKAVDKGEKESQAVEVEESKGEKEGGCGEMTEEKGKGKEKAREEKGTEEAEVRAEKGEGGEEEEAEVTEVSGKKGEEEKAKKEHPCAGMAWKLRSDGRLRNEDFLGKLE